MLESLTKKQKIIFFIILFIMVLFIMYYIYSTLYKNEYTISSTNEDHYFNNEDLVEKDTSNNISISDESTNNTIKIYICGAVKESKVITLNENSRISDAIEAVGGLNTDADLTNINLAYILEDGEKIYIPKKGEESTNQDETSTNEYNTSNITSSLSSKSTKVNINKANQTELESIPGIGPSTASKIINYREENGKFSSIEDIKNVSGIGNTKYENIKDYITVK